MNTDQKMIKNKVGDSVVPGEAPHASDFVRPAEQPIAEGLSRSVRQHLSERLRSRRTQTRSGPACISSRPCCTLAGPRDPTTES